MLCGKISSLEKTINDVKGEVKTINKKTKDLKKMIKKKTSKIEKDLYSMHDSLSSKLARIMQRFKIRLPIKPDLGTKDMRKKENLY